ncbi:porin [Bradyrhizobium genosp. P]|uniref:porin n=1 Tax=Bradyrhizobium genosp. P TaxID=83641 RepID=UPI003CF3AE4A
MGRRAIKGVMRKTSFAIIAVLLPAAAFAQQGNRLNLQTPTDAGKALPSKTTARSNPCASLGPGFVKLEGTDTCVKLGGSIRVDGGMSARR